MVNPGDEVDARSAVCRRLREQFSLTVKLCCAWPVNNVMWHMNVNPLMPGIVFWKPTPRVSASLGHTGHLPNRSFSVCGLACSARFALHGEKAHCSVACSSIHASTFLWPGLQTGPLWSWWFSCKFGLFISWQHTKANHHIYKSQGKPSFIMFTQAWAENNRWKAGCRNTIFTVAMAAYRVDKIKEYTA